MVDQKKLSDEELKVIVDAELATSEICGETSDERSTGMDRYLGEPIGTEMEGRSQVQTRDVMENIEWIMPTLLTIFSEADRAVDIEPVGEEDEDQAEQETDYLNHVFYKKNEGFLFLYTWFKDALLSKNGIAKVFPEENEHVSKEQYLNLLDQEFEALNSDDELELIEHSSEVQTLKMADTGQTIQITVHDATFEKKEDDVRFILENVPPEEFVISRDARSPNPKKARFTAHRTTKTVSELRQMGYTDSQIEKMEFGEALEFLSDESMSRYHLSDEHISDLIVQNTGMRKVKIDECYLQADRDGDGFTETLKILRSGDFIDVEEIDYNPFNAITPIILTHKFNGLSIADILTDIQEIRTMLFRGYMDNINQTLNGKVYYDKNTVNIDDMLTSLPYGLVANDGPPAQSVFVDRPGGLPAESFTLNELLDKFQHNRVGDIQSQLDPSVLAQANTGVVLSMLNEAKAKVYMIARIFAEIGVKPLFRDLHHLARKFSPKEDMVKLRNKWVAVNPQEWRERKDFTVKVGLGIKGRQEKIADVQALIDMQMRYVELGIPMVQPQNLYNASVEYAERLGYTSEKFFTDPQLIPPPQPQPNPQEDVLRLTAEVENAKLQQKHLEVQMQDQRIAEQNQIKAEQNQIKMQELQVKAQDQLAKQDLDRLRAELGQIKDLTENQRQQIDFAIKEKAFAIEQENKTMALAIDAANDKTKNELDKYKTDMNALIELFKSDVQPDNSMIDKLKAELEDLRSKLSEKDAPKDIIYDADGRIVKIGGQKVVRNENGQFVQLGNKKVMRDGSGRAIRLE